MRRLTAAEYSATIKDLLDVELEAELLLPTDWREPFDNDYTTQIPGSALIDGAELLASDVAAAALVPRRRAATVGCEPIGPDDEACFREFIARFGRRALRRPLSPAELDDFASLLVESDETGDFYDAVEVALRAFLQHPEFLYRIEVGTPVPNDPSILALNDFEVASRLSYMLWGSTPSDQLLTLAEAGELTSTEGIRAAAEDMLLDPRALERIARFHSMWLGYEQLPHAPQLADAMQEETTALLSRVLFEDSGGWKDLFSSEQTYINDELAELYGLPQPGGWDWVDYGDVGRKGLLSHGSFLSAAAKIDDTSPTKRGILIRTRLMCVVIPPPPPDANVDNTEPEEGTCKEDFYRGQHATNSGCASCHALFDPIGLGLENYDKAGAYREVEKDDPSCVISGAGDLDGTPFSGPSELADLIVESDKLDRCAAEHLYRFAMGRYELETYDTAFVDTVVEAARTGNASDIEFGELVLSFVSDEAFRHRRDELVE